ncbi:Sialic acid-binding periplasmic protein SiaP precursor [Aquimixticola soesokkakensis]|uniref:Sialic acid-binding periplasmic protein SiaP n=1 Tax=Aquimixticola soesokkakensis TaxID=1519096 RepID=A0A1Y5SV99_9RHOB|nr:TRAP transporter substrate-binding protein [Aquimixticola soesokkakensis]SLN49127.1 Sialic acid-binding periplasmic protein SiaP precursor [Aquimixticola soesokkakensis]
MFVRKLITTLTVASAVTSTLAVASASAEELKFASFMPPGHPYVETTFQPFADAVAEGTAGEVSVKLYNGGELGAGPVEQYSRVVDGVAELAISLPGYTASNFPLTLLTELPGVVEEGKGTTEIWNNIDLLMPEYRRTHLVALWASAENILFTRDKAVRSPDDLAGMKIRVPSRNTGLIVEAWGASPVSMPVSEIYNSLQTGVIDGAMIDGTGINAFKLGEVANYVTMGMKTTISPFFILMNNDAYEDLTDAQKAAIDAAGRTASDNGEAMQVRVAAEGIAGFAATEGKEVIELTEAEAAAFDVLSEAENDNIVALAGGDAEAVIEAFSAD